MGFFLKRALGFGILGILQAVLRALGKYLGEYPLNLEEKNIGFEQE